MRRMRSFVAVRVAALVTMSFPSAVWSQGVKERVSMDGSGHASRVGELRGDEYVDYAVRAGAGQIFEVALRTPSRSLAFHVLAPGSDRPMFDGDRDGLSFSGTAPVDGEYTVRIYFPRRAAERDVSAEYTIAFRVGGNAPRGGTELPNDPSQRPRDIDPRYDRRPVDDRGRGGDAEWPRGYDAEGDLKCSVGEPSLARYCEYRVVRGDRQVDVYVRTRSEAGNRVRRFRFLDGTFDLNGERVASERQNDGYWLKVRDEFYLIPFSALRSR